jgi:hypothetical protein
VEAIALGQHLCAERAVLQTQCASEGRGRLPVRALIRTFFTTASRFLAPAASSLLTLSSCSASVADLLAAPSLVCRTKVMYFCSELVHRSAC